MLSSSPPANLEFKEPLYDVKELRCIAPVDQKQQFDVRSVIARIVDGSEFDEFKKLYGTVRTCMYLGFSILFPTICMNLLTLMMWCRHLLQVLLEFTDNL